MIIDDSSGPVKSTGSRKRIKREKRVSRKDAFVANKPAAGTLIIDDLSGPVKPRFELTGSRKRIKEKNELAQKMLSWPTSLRQVR